MLGSIPAYWAGPLSTVVVVFGSIILLYPLVWKLTIRQLSAAIDALNTAKSLPALAAKIEELGEAVTRVVSGLHELEKNLPESEIWTEKLENLKTLATDLQQTLDQLPGGNSAPLPSSQTTTDAVEGAPDPRDEIGKIWVGIKEHVEGLINSLHGNRRNTYASVTRYRYDQIADMLVYDGKLTLDQKHALIQANARFLSLRNRRLDVSPDDLTSFQTWRTTIQPN